MAYIREKNLKNSEFMYIYNWLTLLYHWNWHIINQLYPNLKKSMKRNEGFQKEEKQS